MKQHSLLEHLHDVQVWFTAAEGPFFNAQTALFLAYERWLNDRPLLSDEDIETVFCHAVPKFATGRELEPRCTYPKGHKGSHGGGGMQWEKDGEIGHVMRAAT
jgi:hypothetical protein